MKGTLSEAHFLCGENPKSFRGEGSQKPCICHAACEISMKKTEEGKADG